MTVEKPKPKQLLQPITTGAESAMNQSQFSSNYLKLARSAGKITRTWCNWFWFCVSLVEKLARVF